MYTSNNNLNYLTILLFTLFTLFGSFNVLCAPKTLKQAVLDGINEDRTSRNKPSLKASSIVNIKQLDAKGTYSSAIYEIEFTKKKPFICKQFKDAEQFENELWRLRWLRDYFNESDEWNFPFFLPHFVKYKGCGEYVDENNQVKKLILLEKAEGICLADLVVDHVFQNETYLSWKRVGTELAKFHLAFGEVKGNTYVSHTHGDLHFSNIFVDDFNLNFIDYATFINSIHSKQDISTDLKEIFGYSYKYYTDEFIKNIKNMVYRVVNSFEVAYQYFKEVVEEIQYIFSEILQGYIDEFSLKGLNVNIDDNGQAKLTPHPVAKRILKLAPISQIITIDSFIQATGKKVAVAKTAPKPALKVTANAAPKPAQKATGKTTPKPAQKATGKTTPKPAQKVTRKT